MTPRERLSDYESKPIRTALGLMSGTSVDAIDAAIVRVAGSGIGLQVELAAHAETPWSPDLRRRILDAASGGADPDTLSGLHRAVGEAFADAAEALVIASGVRLDAVGSHGQTVSHRPAGWKGLPPATLQIGCAATIAQRLAVPVVSDFRSADVALGGQGAPLVPYVDACLFTHPTRTRALQNLGGIGNVTYLSAGGAPTDALGFDTGPANLLIDLAAAWATNGAQTMDEDGRLAARGTVDTETLAWLLALPELSRTPPRSFGREEFGAPLLAAIVARKSWSRPEDVVATVAAFTVESVADAYRRFLPTRPDELLVGGGGARNPMLMDGLARALPGVRVATQAELGIPPNAKEAAAFAVLANETLLGTPANLPRVTGASRPCLLGTVTFR